MYIRGMSEDLPRRLQSTIHVGLTMVSRKTVRDFAAKTTDPSDGATSAIAKHLAEYILQQFDIAPKPRAGDDSAGSSRAIYADPTPTDPTKYRRG